MEYIIFGAGSTGGKALYFLGQNRVTCFADNGKEKKVYCDKEVIDYEALTQMDLSDKIVVIASERYWEYMERQLRGSGITRYFVFRETDPILWDGIMPRIYFNKKLELVSYNRLLDRERMDQYQKIAILGKNQMLPYLISEIEIQSGCQNVCEIISNKKYEAESCMGIPICTWENADKNIDCLVVNAGDDYSGMHEIMESIGNDCEIIDIYDPEYGDPMFYHPELVKYKDIHKGKRIFLIGNGPSLRVEDLKKLHDHHEICIGCNKIYKIYDKTAWRADYFVMSDSLIAQGCIEDLPNIPGEIILSDKFNLSYGIPYYEAKQYIHLTDRFDDKGYPKFSEDICRGTYNGKTIIYGVGLQLAAYMGASEIYLIGVDNTYTADVTDAQNHFIKDYFNIDDKKRYEKAMCTGIDKIKMDKAYEKAESYSRKKGFRIYNATRGGGLEAFERVNFDRLFL